MNSSFSVLSSEAPLRTLLVSYSFPPVGGAGVQRVLKLAKYLPRHGVIPSILTVENPSVPILDETLSAELPPDLEVIRTRTLEPGYRLKQTAWSANAASKPGLRQRMTRQLTRIAKQLLVPDPQVLWQPSAQRALFSRLGRRGHEEVVLISAPPFSQFLLAPTVRLRQGVALILDYRDEWSTYRSAYEMVGSRLVAALGDSLEARLLHCAHAVTTATEEFRLSLLSRFPFLEPARVRAIPNGYDPDDFPTSFPPPPKDRFVLSYAGTIFRLTSARGLLAAIRRLHRQRPDLAKLLEVRFMGRIVDTELDAFEGMEQLGVRRLGYLDHREVISQLAASHMVLCLLDEVAGAERIYPGKIFELMYLRRPCLTLAPVGALTRLVERHRLGPVLGPRDEEAICRLLIQTLEAFRAQEPPWAAEPLDIDRYHRANLPGEFAAVMRLARAQATGQKVQTPHQDLPFWLTSEPANP